MQPEPLDERNRTIAADLAAHLARAFNEYATGRGAERISPYTPVAAALAFLHSCTDNCEAALHRHGALDGAEVHRSVIDTLLQSWGLTGEYRRD